VTVEGALKQKKAEERVKIQSQQEAVKTVLLGGDGRMAEVFRLIDFAASSNSPVLITGETGTGKNLVAKAIHFRSAARAEPFIAINCLSLPENLIEAELFGSEKGAYTGAIAARKGIFEMADGGTILLDEIGEMPLHLQGKLLSVIEDKKVRRLGGEIEKPFNVRITASTNIDIENAVGKSFRKDLYYRLSIMRIHIPPLRERRGDIPVLCQGLLKELMGGKEVNLSDTEMKKLMEYDWPGNVRELKNILERAVILQRDCAFQPSKLLAQTNGQKNGSQNDALSAVTSDNDIMTLEELKNKYIQLTLQKLSGNRIKTAAALGISLNTIKRSIKEIEQK
jgi:transcriptional regulator with PAS, ATPase and Fis domain